MSVDILVESWSLGYYGISSVSAMNQSPVSQVLVRYRWCISSSRTSLSTGTQWTLLIITHNGCSWYQSGQLPNQSYFHVLAKTLVICHSTYQLRVGWYVDRCVERQSTKFLAMTSAKCQWYVSDLSVICQQSNSRVLVETRSRLVWDLTKTQPMFDKYNNWYVDRKLTEMSADISNPYKTHDPNVDAIAHNHNPSSH